MPTSNYAAFDALSEDAAGVKTALPLETISVYDVTNATALSDIASDADGHVGAGTVPVAAGTTVRFSVDLSDGSKGFAEIVTT